MIASIEGLSILLTGRDIKPKVNPPRRMITISGEKKVNYPISIYRNGKGTIQRALENKIPIYHKDSKIIVGESISGISLWGFSEIPVRAGSITKGGKGRTSTHSGQQLIIKGLSFFAVIEDHWHKIVEKHPQDFLIDR